MRRGDRLLDVLARRADDGHLEVMAVTDVGHFSLRCNDVQAIANTTSTEGFRSTLIDSWSGSVIEAVWTDGDSLFLLLHRNHCVVYDFLLPEVTGRAGGRTAQSGAET